MEQITNVSRVLPGGGFHPDVVSTLIQLGPFCSLLVGCRGMNGLSVDPGIMKSDGVQSTLSGRLFFFSTVRKKYIFE